MGPWRAISEKFIASGTIPVSRLVKRDTSTNEHGVVVATSSASPLVGVSQFGSKRTPGIAGSTLTTDTGANAAESGDQLDVYGPTDICRLEVGSGGLLKGSPITSDSAGKGIIAAATTTAAQYYIAGYSSEAHASGDFVLFQFLPQQITL